MSGISGRSCGSNAASPIAFADEMEEIARRKECDVVMSLERIWRCDVYRAGDGVHRAWLERRAEIGGPFGKLRRLFNRKHSAALALEKSLFAKGGARRVIANSRMVKEEIVRFYGYPAEKIDVVHNGVPLQSLQRNEDDRAKTREACGLGKDDIAVLFAGSGWERKGLRFAIEAIERQEKRMTLLVAGRGESRRFKSGRVKFLGVVREMPALYAAADIFLLPTIYDPFSNACLEALAAGLPVVTTRANGFSEIIEPGRARQRDRRSAQHRRDRRSAPVLVGSCASRASSSGQSGARRAIRYFRERRPDVADFGRGGKGGKYKIVCWRTFCPLKKRESRPPTTSLSHAQVAASAAST